ncbi:hypothetical protein MVEN_02526100 [Mycena venus]|uniref:Xylanolytic transcriptional activator regulatory domain-containing protein n=1 Tax=Mycena venus TaxID=2733690 RepID=A0A8H7C9I2_9AGAR|nr:hypothetical protein MVEN_02526100 [Mycena venus]
MQLLPGIDFTEQLEDESKVKPLLQQHVETLPRNDDELPDNKLKVNPETNRFFGKSSGVQLVNTALNFRKLLTGVPLSQNKCSGVASKRNEFWEPPLWSLPPPGETRAEYKFPEADLLPDLVNRYFEEVNPFWPVLHRPTFDRKVAENLHLRDHKFGSTLLMVCSLGARYSDDSRVLLDGVDDNPRHTAGWKWHSQVHVIPKHLIYKPSLYELQTIALSALYLTVISPSAVGWNQIGFGLRRAQDVGAHRRRPLAHPTAENEQWKRVFWVLLCLEWISGTLTGRPLVMHDQDFDQDLPIECDDEYWDLPEPRNFKQPKDRPSSLSFFICYTKILEIQAAVTTTIYSPRKPKDLGGHSPPPTEAQCIMAFDSALNSWLDGIPEYLRWDPARKNILHLNQSAILYTAYYNVQMLLHRPFIPAPFETPPPGALPSLAICTQAARSCVRVFDAHKTRGIILNYNILASVPLYLAAGRFTDVMTRLLYSGENFDSLFTAQMGPTLPPSAQRGYRAFTPLQTFDPNLASEWSSAFVHHHVEDFEAASDQFHTVLNSRLGFPECQYAENDLNGTHATDIDGTFSHVARICGLEAEVTPFPYDVVINKEATGMRSTAARSFYVDESDWPYIMSKDDQLPSEPGQTYFYRIQDLEEAEKFRRGLCGFWL